MICLILLGCGSRSGGEARASLGEACTSNAQCTEACVAGTCTHYAFLNQPCDDVADCDDDLHLCLSGVCSPLEFCGDGTKNSHEQCDDGNTVSELACEYGVLDCSTCNADCSEVLILRGNTCGDRIADPQMEDCDDGPGEGDGQCLDDCSGVQTCGDAVVSGDESCDDGSAEGEGYCLPDCSRQQSCGDGLRQGTEACDDGALQPGDGCSSQCVVESEWTCDLGSPSSCVGPGCGNAIKETDEVCDDGPGEGEGICLDDCSAIQRCGDGDRVRSEVCDDGDNSPGDGCDATCLVEAGWVCTSDSPAVCTDLSFEFKLLPFGIYNVGSPTNEKGRGSDETRHEVTLTGDVWIQDREITQAQFEFFTGWNPSHFGPSGAGVACGQDCPVEMVTWFDLLAYLNEVSQFHGLPQCYTFADVVCEDATTTGTDPLGCMNVTQGGVATATVTLNGVSSVYECEGFRLPTESEWETAARGGVASATYNGNLSQQQLTCAQPHSVLDSIAWFCGNSGAGTHAVGGLAPNDLGLYDVLGNVGELCWDIYGAYPGTISNPSGPASGIEQVVRGGGWQDQAGDCRSAARHLVDPSGRSQSIGGRAARSNY